MAVFLFMIMEAIILIRIGFNAIANAVMPAVIYCSEIIKMPR